MPLSDVDGMPAGKEGRVLRVRGDMLSIGYRSAQRLELVLADLGGPAGEEAETARKKRGCGVYYLP